MAHRRLANSKTTEHNLGPSHISLFLHPSAFLNFCRHNYSQFNMETTSGNSRAEKRVGDGTADISNQTGLLNIGSLGIEYDPSILTEDLEHPRRGEGLADTVI
jgi:hypothetical protein